MSAGVAAAIKAAIAVLSNEEARKKVGWVIVAILSPLIVLVVLLCAILSGTSQHNVSAVELCFHGGSISISATPEYRGYIEEMRNSFAQIDEVIAEINSQCEDGKSLDDTRVKAIFYALYFAAEQPEADGIRTFADCFVDYEERTRAVKRRATANFIQSAQCDKQLFVGADEWIYFKQCGNVFAANHQPATKRKGVHTMKTQKRQVTITDLYNLVAHETVSLLEAVDDNAIPLALEMREGLTMLAAAAGSGEGVETHLEWIDQEIENLKQTAGTPQCVTHLIPTSQLVRTVAIDAQIDMTLEFFRIVAETDEQETRTKLLELARTTTDMCGMGDCLFNCGGDAVEMMNQIWDAFSEATVTENGENRRDLLGKAAVTANELHELTEPQEELEDGRMFMSMDELSAELDEIAHMIARQNNEPQLS